VCAGDERCRSGQAAVALEALIPLSGSAIWLEMMCLSYLARVLKEANCAIQALQVSAASCASWLQCRQFKYAGQTPPKYTGQETIKRACARTGVCMKRVPAVRLPSSLRPSRRPVTAGRSWPTRTQLRPINHQPGPTGAGPLTFGKSPWTRL